MNSTADRAVVLAVVGFIGAFALLGLGGLLWLIHDGIDVNAVAVVAGPVGVALGALGALLASTRTNVAATHEAEAEGYARAVDAVAALDPAPLPVEVVNDPLPVAETPKRQLRAK